MIALENTTDHRLWNSFLESEKNCQLITIAHNPCLADILAMTFGYTPQNKFLRKGGEIVGVLPAVQVGTKLVSMPHFSYGGPLLKSSTKYNMSLNSLITSGKFEVRSFNKWTDHAQENKATFIIELRASAEDQLREFKSSFRTKIRKSAQHGFKVLRGGNDLLDDFYQVYSKKMLSKGSPPLGKLFFQNLLSYYTNGNAVITAIYDDSEIISAGFTLSYLNFNELCLESTNPDYDKYRVNTFLYWNIIMDSIKNEHLYFSMGRSTINSSNHNYKKQWAPMELPLYFNYSEPVGKSLKQYGFLSKIWKLQPLETSIYFGNVISKYVY
jgi:hypothetical protein